MKHLSIIKKFAAILLAGIMIAVPVAALATNDSEIEQMPAEEIEKVAEETVVEVEPLPQTGWATKVKLNGDFMPLKLEPEMVCGTIYVSVYDFCAIMGCEVVWENNGATVTKGTELDMRVPNDSYYLLANGRALFMPYSATVTKNGLAAPITTLAKVFGLSYSWVDSERILYLEGTGKALENADTYYNQEDLYWLARIINAESRGEPFLGQIAVGNVVMNRVSNAQYPNNVHDVIFDFRHGVQFTPCKNGSVYRNPTESAVIAAKLCLDGADVAGSSMYFAATYLRSSWMSRNRDTSMVIGKHCFYY